MFRSHVELVKALLLASGTVAGLAVASGCGDDSEDQRSGTREPELRHGLTEEQAGALLAKIGDDEITVGELADQLADESPYLRARYNNPERRREYFENYVRFRLLALEAKRRGYDSEPEVEQAKKRQMVQQMMRELFEERIRISDITDDEIRTHYESHPDEYAQPEQRRASHIRVSNRALAGRLLEQLKEQPRSDEELFRSLSDRYNEDQQTKDRAGDLRFFSRPVPTENPTGDSAEEPPRVPDAVASAVFSLDEIGDYVPNVVRSEQGYHIVRMTGQRPALRRSLEEARRPIQSKLHRERRDAAIEAFVASLRERAEIVEDYDLLSEVRVQPAMPTVPEATGSPESPTQNR